MQGRAAGAADGRRADEDQTVVAAGAAVGRAGADGDRHGRAVVRSSRTWARVVHVPITRDGGGGFRRGQRRAAPSSDPWTITRVRCRATDAHRPKPHRVATSDDPP